MLSWYVDTPAHTFSEIRLKNGVRLRYAQQGPEDGPAFLMLHGYGDSWFSFSRVLPLLPANAHVIVPDQRGHSASERPYSGYAMDDFATDALHLLDALGVSRATIVGHSLGSFVARRIAERAKARITRLVLLGAAPVARNTVLDDLQKAVDRLVDPVDVGFVREFQTRTINSPVPRDFMARVISESRKVPARVWKAALRGLLAYEPSGMIRCPTMILGGDKDSVFSRQEQEAMAAVIPSASIYLATGIGHAMHWEHPELFVELIT